MMTLPHVSPRSSTHYHNNPLDCVSMKHLYITILLLVSVLVQAGAQTNDSLRREVTVVKDFTPVVREASKINSLPPVCVPDFSRKQVTYSYEATPVDTFSVADSIAIPYSHYDKASKRQRRGYAAFGMGTYLAMAGNAGYHILNTESDKLNVGLQYTSLNWDIPVNTSFPTAESEEATRQTFYDTRVGLHYSHRFESDITLALNGAYRFLNFNYYGTAGNAPTNRSSHPFQWTHNFFAEIQLDNHAAVAYDYSRWSVVGGYSFYGNRWGAYIPDGSSEHHAYVHTAFSVEIGNRWSAGGEVNIDFLQYRGVFPIGTSADDVLHRPELQSLGVNSLFMAELLPYVEYYGSRAQFRAGLHAYISVNDGTIFRFAPDVRFNWEFIDNYFLYINVGGGKQFHTWNDMSQTCIYFDPSQRIPSTYTPLDATGGIRFNILPEFSLSAYGGYEIASAALFQAPGLSSQAIGWRTLDASCVKAGARVDVTLGTLLTIMADATYRLWRQGEQEITFDRPRWEANARVTLHPHAKFDVEAGYNMQLQRDFGVYGRLADIHNLQATLSYHPLDFLTVYVQGNNLLNCRYDYYYGLAAPRLQVMGGVSLKF